MEKSTGVVVVDGKKVLVLKYSPGNHWDLPKGHVEKGESEEQTALRELAEETALDATILPGFRERIEYWYTREGKRAKKEVVFFVGKATKNNVTLSHEHSDFAWLSFDDAIKKVTYDSAKGVLRKAQAFLGA